MAKQSVNIGTTANDNTGDPLRTAFDKLNDNHDEIYAAGPVGTNLQVASNTIASTNSNGNVKIDPAGTGSIELAGPIDAQGVLTLSSTVSGDIVPTANVTTKLGSDTVRFSEVHGNVLHVGSLILREVSNTLEIFRTDDSTNAILNGNSTTSGSVLANGTSQVKVNASGTIQLFSATSDAANATTISTASMTTPALTATGNITGGNLTTAGITNTASAIYSGDSTTQTTAYIPHAVSLTANASTISSSMTNFFPSAISLVTGKQYEFRAHLVFENSSTGAVSIQFTDSGTQLDQIHLQGAFMNSSSTITADVSITGTGSTAVASNSNAVHHGIIQGMITVSGATNLNIQASVASGTITPMKGSTIRVFEFGSATIGNTA